MNVPAARRAGPPHPESPSDCFQQAPTGRSARAGNDLLRGNSGRDRISGGSGNERVRGGSGHDRLNCGPGHDHVTRLHGDHVAANCEAA